MASGYRSGGVDFDDLFDPYVEGTKPAITGRRVGGVDLRERYAPISFGSKRGNVGFRVGGVDVSNLWAAKGTAVYDELRLPSLLLSSSTDLPVSNAHCTIEFRNDGTAWGYSNSPQATTHNLGRWLVRGTAADFEIRFTRTGGTITNPTGSPLGTWRRLNAAQSISAELWTVGSADLQFRVEIRKRTTHTPAVEGGGAFTLSFGGGGVTT